MPAPQVDSAVIQLNIRKETPAVCDEKLFFKIIRGIFTLRRKTISNALSGSMGIDKSAAADILAKADILPTARPEQLTMPQLIALCEAYRQTTEAHP